MSELGPYPEPTPLEEFVGQAGAILKWVGVVVVGMVLARVFQGGLFRLLFACGVFCGAMALWLKSMRWMTKDIAPTEATDYWFIAMMGFINFLYVILVTIIAYAVAS